MLEVEYQTNILEKCWFKAKNCKLQKLIRASRISKLMFGDERLTS